MGKHPIHSPNLPTRSSQEHGTGRQFLIFPWSCWIPNKKPTVIFDNWQMPASRMLSEDTTRKIHECDSFRDLLLWFTIRSHVRIFENQGGLLPCSNPSSFRWLRSSRCRSADIIQVPTWILATFRDDKWTLITNQLMELLPSIENWAYNFLRTVCGVDWWDSY